MFMDSSGWLGAFEPRDQYHAQASRLYDRPPRGGITLVPTNLVVAETYMGVRRTAGGERALRFLDLVQSRPQVEKVYATEELEMAAEQILRQFRDHEFSYTDAVSFALMRERRLTTAFAFDRHFLVAGFHLLPPLA